MAEIPVTELTQASLDGGGVFDQLMRASKAHLDEEWTKNRIRGPEYSQVYLGSLSAAMQHALQFVLEKQRADKQAELLGAQIVTEARQQALLEQQVLSAQAEQARTEQQTANLNAEGLNIPKQGQLLDAQVAQTQQQTTNLVAEALNIPKQGAVLDGQRCKLDAEFDVLVEQKLKTVGETALLAQKKATEKAQTSSVGVDPESYIGRQTGLYHQQAEGFKRDAEQKAAKVLVDTWNVRRTTDEGTIAGASPDGGVDNRLGDADIGRVIAKLMNGVGA